MKPHDKELIEEWHCSRCGGEHKTFPYKCPKVKQCSPCLLCVVSMSAAGRSSFDASARSGNCGTGLQLMRRQINESMETPSTLQSRRWDRSSSEAPQEDC
jgi:hypothetical protein